jgi:hypothetical protein
MRTRIDQSTFQAGELDPLAAGRFDAKTYYQGGAKLRNVWPLVTGGVRRRPGLRYVGELAFTDAARSWDFTFNDDQAYELVFQNARVDIWLSDGTFCQTITGAPWTLAMVPKLAFAQRGDVLVVTHRDMPMQKLTRTGSTTFALSAWAFDFDPVVGKRYSPHRKFCDTAVTLTPSATAVGAAVTLTMGGTGAGTGVNVFTANHVGTRIRYKGKEINVTGFTSSTVVSGIILELLPASTADQDWTEEVFGAHRGYARTVAFHEDRTYFGGSRDYPPGLWGSKINAPYNFDLGSALDTDSIWSAIGTETVAEIRGLVSFRNLLVFTDIGEFYVPTATNKPITPTSIAFRKQTPYGSASIRPRPFDGAVAFVQKTGTSIREMTFNELEQAYNSFGVSTLASHLIVSPVDMAVLAGSVERPEQLLFVVMGDGSLAVLHSNRNEQFTGWFKWTTNGSFKAVSVSLDRVYVVVERTIAGVKKWLLEVFDWSCRLDCSKAVSAVGPAPGDTTFTGFTHLASATGCVAAAAAYGATNRDYSMGAVTVSAGGAVTLPTAVGLCEVGFNFVPTIQPMPLQVQTQQGVITNRPKRVVRATLVIDDSLGFAVNGVSLVVRQAGDDLSLPIPRRTGRFDIRLLGWDRNGQPTITQDEPGPFTLLGFELESIV